jgi:hypothetical protein
MGESDSSARGSPELKRLENLADHVFVIRAG